MYTYRLSLLHVMLNYCHSCCRLFDLSELANLFLYAVKKINAANLEGTTAKGIRIPFK